MREPLWFGPDGTPVPQWTGYHHGQSWIYDRWMVGVNMTKDASTLRHAGVRTPDYGASYDLGDWERAMAPLWWDDSSYARYQADDGPYGEDITELRLHGDGAPIVRGWRDYEFPSPSLSRPIRAIASRFGDIVEAIKAAGATDREVIWTGCGGRW